MDQQIHTKTITNSNYNHLKNKTREEVARELGLEGNIYTYSFWYYVLNTNWMGRRMILVLQFGNNKVITTKIIKTWSRQPPRIKINHLSEMNNPIQKVKKLVQTYLHQPKQELK